MVVVVGFCRALWQRRALTIPTLSCRCCCVALRTRRGRAPGLCWRRSAVSFGGAGAGGGGRSDGVRSIPNAWPRDLS